MIASIDIGTSYSSICVLGSDGKVYPVKVATDISLFGGDYTLPTAVFLEENGTMLVGQAAMNKSRKNPENFSWQFKRMLGQDKPVFLGGQEYPVEKLYTELIFYMKTCAEKSFGESIEKVYLTHPAAYGTGKKEKLIKAARGAGIFSVELIDEPTAAALNCCEESRAEEGQIILIYDFGGGTFDASLVRSNGESFELMAEPMGLEDCGGKDVDYFIARDMMRVVGNKAERLDRKRFDNQLLELAVKGKHHLSVSEIYEEDINVGLEDIPYSLTRSHLNEGIADKVGRTIEVCVGLLNRAGVKKEELSAIWMVGGSSHIPLVQEMVKRFAGEVKVRQARDMELAVALGALELRRIQILKDKADRKKESSDISKPVEQNWDSYETVICNLGENYFYKFFKENFKENFERIDRINHLFERIDRTNYLLERIDRMHHLSAKNESTNHLSEKNERGGFLNEKFWLGCNESINPYVEEMFLESAKCWVSKLAPDLSHPPYFEWCYGNFLNKENISDLSEMVGAWSLGIYRNGIFTRHIVYEGDEFSYDDQRIPWSEFLLLRISFRGLTCFLGTDEFVKTANRESTRRIYRCMNKLQKKLAQEVGKVFPIEILIKRETRFTGCMRKFVFMCDQERVYIGNGEEKMLRVNPGAHILKIGDKDLLGDGDDCDRRESIPISLNIGDRLVIDLTINEEKAWHNGRLVGNFKI